jgi:hypothetical protein
MGPRFRGDDIGKALALMSCGFAMAVSLSASALAQAPLPSAKTALVPFDSAPFPYQGLHPKTGTAFLDIEEGERRGRKTARGTMVWEDLTYKDRRVLLTIPRGFDLRKPALIVVFFHGLGATLARDVRDRQQVPRQVMASGLNAVLVAPQFGFDAPDPSAGRFWEPGAFAQFLAEAADHLGSLHGDKRAREAFLRAPVVITAYSGGYHPLAYVLAVGGTTERVRGVILLDALYSDHDKFLDWLATKPQAFFMSTYGPLVKRQNEAFQKELAERGIPFMTGFPPHLVPGIVAFMEVGKEVKHHDFVTQAWSPDPLKAILSRVPGYARR